MRLLLLACSTAAVSVTAMAEQTQTNGTGTLSTDAKLNFRIVVPRFIRFGVGTGAALAGTSGTVDTVSFEPTLDELGSGTALSAASNGTVSVALVANGGAVSITATNSLSGGMSDGESTPEFIPFSTISSASSDANFPVPPPSTGQMDIGILFLINSLVFQQLSIRLSELMDISRAICPFPCQSRGGLISLIFRSG